MMARTMTWVVLSHVPPLTARFLVKKGFWWRRKTTEPIPNPSKLCQPAQRNFCPQIETKTVHLGRKPPNLATLLLNLDCCQSSSMQMACRVHLGWHVDDRCAILCLNAAKVCCNSWHPAENGTERWCHPRGPGCWKHWLAVSSCPSPSLVSFSTSGWVSERFWSLIKHSWDVFIK